MRIYLDKQIFSHFFKKDRAKYNTLFQDLVSIKDKFIFLYSHAHLLDLEHDLTSTKYDELNFIQELVQDNYMTYDPEKKVTDTYLVYPEDAFNSMENDIDFSFQSLLDGLDFEYATSEQKKQFEVLKDTLFNTKIDFGFINLDTYPEEFKGPLSKIFPVSNGKMTVLEWTELFMNILRTMETDKSVYRGVRGIIDKYLNCGKFTINLDDLSFNDDLKSSHIGKSFIEYVNSNLNPSGDKEVSNYEFFTNAYLTLDLLGISKEPAKKVRFSNILNDGLHAYYGAHSDIVVSEDQGFLTKTKVMYKLLGIDVDVFSVDEFINNLPLLSRRESSAQELFDNLLLDLNAGYINRYQSYFSFFNEIEKIETAGEIQLVFRRKRSSYSVFVMYKEYQHLINNATKLLGLDSKGQGEFHWLQEIKELENNEWAGRHWEFDNFEVSIENLKDSMELVGLFRITKVKE